MKRGITATVAAASALALAALLTLTLTGNIQPTMAAASPECPADWPQPAGGGHGISHQDFHTDGDGNRWFVTRSTDSNGYTLARAYPADGRYSSGYGAGSPDETCFMKLRGPDEAEDLADPPQIEFRREREETANVTNRNQSQGQQATTLRQILDGMSPAERASVILCLLDIVGNVDVDEFLDDPANVQKAREAGCIP